jgi:hypothetical protein
MGLLGVWWVIAGIAGIAKDDIFLVGEKYVFKFNVTTWGWIHLILGIVLLFAAYGIFQGAVWARTAGVIVAAVSGLIAFAWLPAYPVWGLLFVVASVFVIWALTVHGRDLADE